MEEVEEYINTFPIEIQKIAQEIRNIIKNVDISSKKFRILSFFRKN